MSRTSGLFRSITMASSRAPRSDSWPIDPVEGAFSMRCTLSTRPSITPANRRTICVPATVRITLAKAYAPVCPRAGRQLRVAELPTESAAPLLIGPRMAPSRTAGS
jgi:hypothetical protein